MHSRFTIRTLFFAILTAWAVTLTLPLRDSAQTPLTTVPAESTIDVSVAVQPPLNEATLSYRWRVTDGTVVDVNAPATTWTLPAGQGVHFIYALVSNGQGGYAEKRLAIITTDPLATSPAVVSGAPRPAIPPVPSSAAPVGMYRSWLSDQRPDVLVELIDAYSGAVFGPVSTDLQGQYTFFNVPVSNNYLLYLSDAPGQSFRESIISRAAVGDTTAYTEYATNTNMPYLDQIGNTVVAGKVALQDGSRCGISDPFFDTEVTAAATLLDSTNTVVSGPVRVNTLGYYQLGANVSTSGSYTVQVACEGAPVQTAPVSIAVTPAATNVYRSVNVTVPSTAPLVNGFSASWNGVPIQIPSATANPLPSDNFPESSRFLAIKGIDSRLGACQYYLAIGAVQSCDTSGNPSGGITFDVWKQQSGLLPYNSGGELQAAYVNQVDLNLTRNHHGILNGNNVAMYVCNYLGPGDDTVQAQVMAAVDNAVNNRTLVACVAMDYTTIPGVNGGAPFTRFFTFGPSGNLLLSINLDGRGEKFLPGSCVACHGGDNYAGHYPSDGTGVANIGAHFLPFDTGNFVFSDATGLTLPDQAAQIKGLNQLVLKTNATTSAQNLINAWYTSGSNLEDNSYIPTAWSNLAQPTDQAMYSGVIKHSCRTCHVALPNDTAQPNSFDLDSDNDHHSTINQSTCGGTSALWSNHTMPNSKVTFDRMWSTQGTANDEIASITAWLQANDPTYPPCTLTQPDPTDIPQVTGSATTYSACQYDVRWGPLNAKPPIFVSGDAQSVVVTVSPISGGQCQWTPSIFYSPTWTVSPTTQGAWTQATITFNSNAGPSPLTAWLNIADSSTAGQIYGTAVQD